MSRMRIFAEGDRARIDLWVTVKEKQSVRDYCEENSRSMSDVFREFIRNLRKMP